MARVWTGPPPDPPPPPIIVVPPHAVHGRLRDRLIADLGLDDDASDDAIVIAVRLLLPAP